MACPAIATASSDRARKLQNLERHLVRGGLDPSHAGHDRGGDQQRAPQRGGPDEEVAADARESTDRGPVRAERHAEGSGRTGDPVQVDRRAAGLGEHRRGRRGADPEVEAVDEDELHDEVHDRGADRDGQRRPGVLEATQVAGAGHRDEEGGRAEEADAQVDERVRPHRPLRPERVDDGRSGHREHDPDEDRQEQRQPHALQPLAGRLVVLACADEPGHRAGRAVREEHEQEVRREQHARRDAEPGQLVGAEVADHRRVDQHVQRLGHQRPERGDRQPQDLPISSFAVAQSSQSTGVLARRRPVRRTKTAPTSTGTRTAASETEVGPLEADARVLRDDRVGVGPQGQPARRPRRARHVPLPQDDVGEAPHQRPLEAQAEGGEHPAVADHADAGGHRGAADQGQAAAGETGADHQRHGHGGQADGHRPRRPRPRPR